MKKTVVIVDDDTSFLEAITYALEDEGYVVKVFSDGPKFLTYLKENRPHLVVVDWLTPWDTKTLVTSIKEQENKIPIVLCTASIHIATLYKKVSVDAYLEKPFDLDKLLTIIQVLT